MPDDPIAQWKADNPWCEKVGLVPLSAAQCRSIAAAIRFCLAHGIYDDDLVEAGQRLEEQYREIERQCDWASEIE